MKKKDIVEILGGAAVGGVAGYFVGSLTKTVRIYVSNELTAYVTALSSSGIYVSLFDINKSGAIELADYTWFAARIGTWVELQA